MEEVRDQVQSLEQESLATTVDPSVAVGDNNEVAEAAVSAADPAADQQADIEALLAAAEEDIEAYRLSSPRDNNALQKYREILELDPTSEPALQGIEAVAIRYVQMAQTATADARLDEAARYLEQAGKLSPTNEEYIEAQNALIEAQETASTDSAAER